MELGFGFIHVNLGWDWDLGRVCTSVLLVLVVKELGFPNVPFCRGLAQHVPLDEDQHTLP
jgi:hypothetical protein